MYQNSNSALERNALYGEITSNIMQIKNVELLKKMNDMIKKFISKASSKKEKDVITPALQAKIDLAREEHKKGQCVTLRSREDVDKYFASL